MTEKVFSFDFTIGLQCAFKSSRLSHFLKRCRTRRLDYVAAAL